MPSPPPAGLRGLDRLDALVTRLRAPDGCPWDRKQRLGDLRAYLLEEAHEVAAALDDVQEAPASGSDPAPAGPSSAGPPAAEAAMDHLATELGDLLFQIVFVARLATEAGAFDLDLVVDRIFDKMVRRHPHVFSPGDGTTNERNPSTSAESSAEGNQTLDTAAAVQEAWEARKVRQGENRSLLAGVPRSMPSLLAAYRMTQKASGVGFDWPDRRGVLGKVHEELAELEEAVAEYDSLPAETSPAETNSAGSAQEDRSQRDAKDERHQLRSNLQDELGDFLFTIANLARVLDIDPEAALAGTNAKFRRRFGHIEAQLATQSRTVVDASLEEMDALWDEAKALERGLPTAAESRTQRRVATGARSQESGVRSQESGAVRDEAEAVSGESAQRE
ncbi:MAG: nucleoside triphosphate pyrophosphohydrolase [Acidobacteriota bacterium]